MRARALAAAALLVAAGSCRFDPSYRDELEPIVDPCVEGVVQCSGATLARCEGKKLVPIDECGARSLTCAPSLLRCTPCLPGGTVCAGQELHRCTAEGELGETMVTCDGDKGEECRLDGCVNLCTEAAQIKSNVGCEYWGVDLDNAVTSSGNAAAQQYAIIVSNPHPQIVARVTVEEDTAKPGEPANVRTVAQASVGPRSLEVFRLGPKEVDGSTPDGPPNNGTHTALTRGAFRVRSHVPIVAYQFNPLDNVNVFSNDASLLLPTFALTTTGRRSYVVASWPQTIARSDVPDTTFRSDLRAFLTIVGTAPDTKVHLKTKARIVPGGPFEDGVPKDGEVDATLQPFDVLNLETGDFNADFTGSLIDADGPVVVFVGSEASDAPFFEKLSDRYCCADHLEDQLTPLRAVGKRYAIGRVPSRTRALASAGAAIAPFNEPEYYRVVATAEGATTVTTTLGGEPATFVLDGEGAHKTFAADRDFVLNATKPVIVADVQASQDAAGIKSNLPGGDPSITLLPPVEQWRLDNVFLTPDKYSFDFVVISAPAGATVFLDGLPVDAKLCEVAPNGFEFQVFRCQLSFPAYDAAKAELLPGRQNDGVHRVQSDVPVGVIVYGFDRFVSYAYAAGTQLVDVDPN
ncbi:MAG: IgGFc-binding protein [Labilithrix sp.]|nr:IgGFc-binding protein [Labilithrix sp.]MCW5814097.1 IgGFc-binding protein [Labilithrix sp.]